MNAEELWKKSDEYIDMLCALWGDSFLKDLAFVHWENHYLDADELMREHGEIRLQDYSSETIRNMALSIHLKTSFLFPQLNESDRQIVELMAETSFLTSLGVHGFIAERKLREVEIEHVDLRTYIADKILPQLADAQKQVLAHKFFKVDFS